MDERSSLEEENINLDAPMIKCLSFKEKLSILSESGRMCGHHNLAIEPTNYLGESCLMVNATSEGNLDGIPCGTSITGFVKPDLSTLEFRKLEFIKLDDKEYTKKIYFIKEVASYYCHTVTVKGKDVIKESRDFDFGDMQSFLSECALFILQRYAALRGLAGKMKYKSLGTDGELCTLIFNMQEPEDLEWDNEEKLISAVQVTQRESNRNITWNLLIDTQEGKTLSKEQVGCVLKFCKWKGIMEQGSEKKKWKYIKDDMELFSKFLDRKSLQKAEHQSYVHDHPELKCMLTDFLQAILLQKPEDVVEFAVDYFLTFSPLHEEVE